jgi:hypothetical protein
VTFGYTSPQKPVLWSGKANVAICWLSVTKQGQTNDVIQASVHMCRCPPERIGGLDGEEFLNDLITI